MKINPNAIFAVLALFITGCDHSSIPSKSEIVSEFKKEHPAATVVSAIVGDGDFEHSYWNIKFTEPGDPKVREIEWGTRSLKKSDWEIFSKNKVTP